MSSLNPSAASASSPKYSFFIFSHASSADSNSILDTSGRALISSPTASICSWVVPSLKSTVMGTSSSTLCARVFTLFTMEKKIPNRKIHAAMVITEAMENMKFLLMFLTPCFRVYQIVLGLIIFSLFLVADDYSIMHGQYTLFHGIDNLFVVGYYQNGGTALIDLLKQLHDFL